MQITQDLLCTIHAACENPIAKRLLSLQEAHSNLAASFRHGSDFKKMPFLPTLMDQINIVAPDFRLPQVLNADSAAKIIPLFQKLELPLPTNPTVARLLDSLASRFIEPLCQEPTFITNHPAIMSPLAKSFLDPETGHLVSARAELFIRGTEYVNMYEEENDPFMQAQKFLLQAQKGGKEDLDLSIYGHDEVAQSEAIKKRLSPGQRYYVRVLEMGLPPTGGWGGGIDRLVMLFGGAKRINDVLPFGNLRNVVAMGTDVMKVV
jgi:lysyl-tRNA synthetase class 2